MTSVSRETSDLLATYVGLVRRWNGTVNLFSRGDMEILHDRHVVDGMQVAEIAGTSAHWCDLGSGGGVPGLVAAIMRRGDPDARTVLVESDVRKATFLREAARQLALRVTVRCERIERLRPVSADVVSARALAPLAKLLEYAWTHVSPSAKMLFPKGERWREEVERAEAAWRFSIRAHPSRTRPGAAILEIDDVRPA